MEQVCLSVRPIDPHTWRLDLADPWGLLSGDPHPSQSIERKEPPEFESRCRELEGLGSPTLPAGGKALPPVDLPLVEGALQGTPPCPPPAPGRTTRASLLFVGQELPPRELPASTLEADGTSGAVEATSPASANAANEAPKGVGFSRCDAAREGAASQSGTGGTGGTPTSLKGTFGGLRKYSAS